MPQYMLLLHFEPSAFVNMSPAEMQKATEKFVAWSQKPFTRDNKRLADDVGKVLRTKGGQKRACDGPYSETKEVLGGYYTIEAGSYDDAVKLALDHPTLEYGGAVEVRHVWGS